MTVLPRPSPAFPWLSVFAGSTSMFSHAYSMTSPFPYLGLMVVHFGLADNLDSAGYYAGVVGAAFMIGRTATALLWGLLSDRIGRKPVLIFCLLCQVLGQLLFGLAPSFGVAVLARLLLGLTNGIVGTAKTVIGELVPESGGAAMQSRAMSALSSGVNIGVLLGPGIGGLLVGPSISPASSPFVLPSLVGAGIAILSASLVWCFVPETFHQKEGQGAGCRRRLCASFSCCCLSSGRYAKIVDTNNTAEEEAAGESKVEESRAEGAKAVQRRRKAAPASSSTSSTPPPSLRSVCRDRRVVRAIALYTLHSGVDMFIAEVFPLWCLVSRKHGGPQMTTGMVGAVVSGGGGAVVAYQLLIFPFVTRRYPPRTFLYVSMLLLLPVSVVLPFSTLVAGTYATATMNKTGDDLVSAGNSSGFINASADAADAADAVASASALATATEDAADLGAVVVIAAMRALQACIAMTAFTACFVLINESATKARRGVVNGLAMTVASVTKGLGPLVGAPLLAWSVTNGISYWPLNHGLSFLLAGILWSAFGCLAYCLLPKGAKPKELETPDNKQPGDGDGEEVVEEDEP